MAGLGSADSEYFAYRWPSTCNQHTFCHNLLFMALKDRDHIPQTLHTVDLKLHSYNRRRQAAAHALAATYSQKSISWQIEERMKQTATELSINAFFWGPFQHTARLIAGKVKPACRIG